MSRVMMLDRPAGRRSTRRKWRAGATVLLGLAVLATGCSKKPGLGQDFFSNVGRHAYLAPFHPANFHHPTVITNPYYPLAVGATWRWKDRKSTRLNSSHVEISYAVFCLKKKNKK